MRLPLLLPLALLACRPPQTPMNERLPYPATRRAADSDSILGVAVPDPFRWLEDGASTEVRTWANAQDTLARKYLAALPERDAFARRLRDLSYVEAMGTPRKYGSRLFYMRRAPTQEKWVVCTREHDIEHVLLDPNTWSTDGSKSLGGYWPTWDGTRVAYKTKINNSDEAILFVLDVATGRVSDTLEGAKYAAPSWTPSGDGFYYVYLPSGPHIPTAERPGFAEVRFHKLGDNPATDRVVRERTGDAATFQGIDLSKSGRWLFATVMHGWTRSDVHYQDLREPSPTWKPLAVGKDALFDVDEYGDLFYVRTNHGAPRWRIDRVDPKTPERWTSLVPERPDATLHGSSIVGRHLSLAYLKDVVTELEVRTLDGTFVRQVPLPAAGSASTFVGDPDDNEAYYAFTSYTHATDIQRTQVDTGQTELWYRLKVPVDTSRFSVERRFAVSKDGTRVPYFVVAPKDRRGPSPTILWGYGGFQNSVTPGFVPSIFPWLERGGVYVFASLRGGSEYGEAWHRAGMGRVKQNVFDDFFAVAEDLLRTQVTVPQKLVIRGGSNGGLLVGAALTQRPELFRAVLCAVPLLDMVRYHRFGSGKTWVPEYGSPEDPGDLRALFAYSPYHHVKDGTAYPAVLLLTADSDDRVDPMHARKFAARLQEASTGGPVLLRVERNSGHGGADLVKAAVEKGADEYAFALAQVSSAVSGW
ncbi:MAG: prolyl oligopeptidase family serine peptidase [Myxococcales bacterium]